MQNFLCNSTLVTVRTQRWKCRRQVGGYLIACGVLLIPWLIVLSWTLPDTTTVSGWSTAWLGLDASEALGLLGTGLLLRKWDSRVGVVAASTSTLLVMDAWLDVITSTPGPARTIALSMALLLELPLAVICAALALRATKAVNFSRQPQADVTSLQERQRGRICGMSRIAYIQSGQTLCQPDLVVKSRIHLEGKQNAHYSRAKAAEALDDKT